MHGPYEGTVLKPSRTGCEQPDVDGRSVAAVTNKKLPYVLPLEPPSLRLPTLHSGRSLNGRGYKCSDVTGKFIDGFQGAWLHFRRAKVGVWV